VQLTIIGAGAIGGTIGAHLIRDGHDVLLCDADQEHVDAINRRGLSIEGRSRTSPPPPGRWPRTPCPARSAGWRSP
jgi:ketopantoate reductase